MKSLYIFIAALIISMPAFAQQKPNEGMENVYRGVKSSDLPTFLPPRLDDRVLGDDEFFRDANGGCPDEISIGSVSGDTNVTGSVDIDVYLDNDITIICGGT